MQANIEGDLPERARRRAMEIANDADIRMMPPRERKPRPAAATAAKNTVVVNVDSKPSRSLSVGQSLQREYKGQNIVVGQVAKQHSNAVPQINFAAPEVERLGHRTAVQKLLVDRIVDELPIAFGSHNFGVKQDSQMVGDVGRLWTEFRVLHRLPLKPSLNIIAAVAVVFAGLTSRRYQGQLPAFLVEYAGDTLWARMFFCWSARYWLVGRS